MEISKLWRLAAFKSCNFLNKRINYLNFKTQLNELDEQKISLSIGSFNKIKIEYRAR